MLRRGSIILASNEHVRDWPEIIADDKILTIAVYGLGLAGRPVK